MSDNQIIHQLTLKEDEAVTVVKKREPRKRPNFTMIGNGTMNKDGVQARDLLREMTQMTKAELYTLIWIRDAIYWENRTGEVALYMADLTSTQQRQFKSGFKSLHEKDLVRRIKRSHYMINPNALIPLDYEAALELWNSIE
jgi:hypothetical protein